MRAKRKPIPVKDDFVIYYSNTDKSWIAHSLRTDQLGFGDCVVDAIADLMVGLHNLYELAKKDTEIIVNCEAPEDIKKLAKNAKKLDDCILDIAIKKFRNRWPKNYQIHLEIPHSERLTAQYSEVCSL